MLKTVKFPRQFVKDVHHDGSKIQKNPGVLLIPMLERDRNAQLLEALFNAIGDGTKMRRRTPGTKDKEIAKICDFSNIQNDNICRFFIFGKIGRQLG